MKLNLSLVDQHRGNGVSSSLTIGYKIRKRSSKLRVGSWLRQKDIVVIVLVWWFEDVFAMFSVAELRPGNTCGCMMLLLFMEVKNKVFKWTCEQGQKIYNVQLSLFVLKTPTLILWCLSGEWFQVVAVRNLMAWYDRSIWIIFYYNAANQVFSSIFDVIPQNYFAILFFVSTQIHVS